MKIRQLYITMKAVAYATYKEWAAYRTHMWVSLFVGPVYFMVQFFIWTAVYQNEAGMPGMGLNDILRYYGISAIIGYLTFDFAEWNLQMLIHTGKYTSFLHRPVSHIYFAFCQKIGHRTLGFFNEFLPVCLLFYAIFHVNLLPENLLWGIITVSLSFIMTFLFHYAIGLSAFWLTRSNGLSSIINLIGSICSGALIPLAFFPMILQKLMVFLPFQYTIYVPVRIFMGDYGLAGTDVSVYGMLLMQALMVIFMWGVTVLVEKAGIKKYTGVGA